MIRDMQEHAELVGGILRIDLDEKGSNKGWIEILSARCMCEFSIPQKAAKLSRKKRTGSIANPLDNLRGLGQFQSFLPVIIAQLTKFFQK